VQPRRGAYEERSKSRKSIFAKYTGARPLKGAVFRDPRTDLTMIVFGSLLPDIL